MRKTLSIRNAEEALYFLKKEQERRDEYFWTTHNGTTINIQDMDNAHLQHTINCLEKFLDERQIVLENSDCLEY